ncbi:acid protease [Rhodocollybia butyracea]|uniref:Acid protease n=1 Tax=Rhodocollybia butyracea TaxID=206335 RepID=A0A9P5U038_9AGAR|nr:acid protease [Rhodocollybia butyracea]
MSERVVVESIPFTAALGRTKAVSNFKHIVEHDRGRAQKLMAGLHPHGPNAFHEARRRHHHKATGGSDAATPSGSGSDSIDVTDAAVTYMMNVSIGGQAFNLLIDTGSSNTWCGANTEFVPNSSVESTRESVNVSYGSGSFSGTEFTGPVVLGGGDSGLSIPNQSFGVASTSQGFSDTDGILGIGPTDLTSGTVSGTGEVPTVTDNLFNNGTIPAESIGISFEPTTGTDLANGELTFGGVDESKITGDITFVPITSTSPASQFWGIDQSVSYGSDMTILNSTAGIVDTGTTLLMIATDAFQAYQQATGATLDQTTGLLKLTASEFDNLQSLFFQIGGTTFEFTPNAQIWPRSMNTVLGGNDDSIYLIVADLGTNSGSGLDFINGFGWLQRFYSVFDTTNSQVGIATTPFTDADTN